MTKIQSPQSIVDEKGLSYIRGIISSMQCKFEETPRQFDYGFNGYIHLFEEKNLNNKKKRFYIPGIIRIQLKSGDSFFNEDKENNNFYSYVRENDIDIWKGSNTPVILILYNESENKAYWINIRKYIEDSYSGKGNLKVIINKDKELTKNSYIDFVNILYDEIRGLPNQQLKIYKPIYDFLLEGYYKEDLAKLKKYRDEYENSVNSSTNKSVFTKNEIQKTIDLALSQRRLYSLNAAISILETLNRKLNFSKNKTNKTEIIKINYYLCILYMEDSKFEDAEILLKTLSKLDKSNNGIIKHKLLCALIYDGRKNFRKSLKNYEDLILLLKTKNINLKGVICLFAGVLCRKCDEYNKSYDFFSKSIIYLKDDRYLLPIAKSNMGALSYIMNDFGNSIKYYNEAMVLFEKTADKMAMSTLYKNLSDVNRDNTFNERISLKKSWDLFEKSMQTKPKNEFEILDNYELEGHSDYSEELVRLSHNKKSSFSYSYNDGYKNFCRAENLSDHLGNLFGKRSAQYQNAKYLYLIGKSKNDFNSLSYSLFYSILLFDEDRIRDISNLGISTKNFDTFITSLKWINEIKGDRRAIIGRLVFYREFSDYIPENFLKRVFGITNDCETSNMFDFEGYSNKAFEELAVRLDKTQTKKLLKKILVNIKNDNRIITESNLDLLDKLNFKLLNKNDLIGIINNTEMILSKVQNKYSIYLIWQHVMMKSENKQIIEIVFSSIQKQYNYDLSKIGFFEMVALSNSLFKKLRNKDLNNNIVEFFCNSLKDESVKDTLYSYSIGGFNVASILARMFLDCNTQLQNKIADYLINYINCENLIPSKRTQAVSELSKLGKSISQKKITSLHRGLVKILKNDFKELHNYYYEEDNFDPDAKDFKKLKSVVIRCLAKTGYKKIDYLLSEISSLLIEDLKPSTLISIIISLGEIGMCSKNNKKNLNKIISFLFQYSNSEDTNILSWSIKYLSRLIYIRNEQYLEMIMIRLNQLKVNNNHIIRWIVSNACGNLKSNGFRTKSLTSLILELKKDINWEVREEANKIFRSR